MIRALVASSYEAAIVKARGQVAEVAAFLARPEAAWGNGQLLTERRCLDLSSAAVPRTGKGAAQTRR